MKPFQSLALLLFISVPLGCRSNAPQQDVPCTCGQPAADIEGCAHHLCLKGQRNPDNPDCICGSLTIPK